MSFIAASLNKARLLSLLILIMTLCLVNHTFAQALTRTVGVSGTTLAGMSFTLEIEAAPTYTRAIDFDPIEVDYPPAAMAELMVSMINQNYREFGKTGFTASNVNSRPENKEFDATFVISCTVPITGIKVGMLGNPSVPIPRAPGVAFNPNIITFDANIPHAFQGPQLSQANASFSINGETADFDLFRRVKVLTSQNINLHVSSLPNVGQPFVMMAGIYNFGAYQAPWGDFLDIGTYSGGVVPPDIQVLADGINPTNVLDAFFRTNALGVFDLDLFVTDTFAGVQGLAYQCLVLDPTNAPLALRLTNAVNPSYEKGQRLGFTPQANGAVEVIFTPGFSFDFFGATYTSAFVHEDGFLTFGGAGLLGNMIDPIVAANDQPAIFVNWADWDLSGSQVDVFQFGDEMRISWGSASAPISHTGDVDAANFTCILRLTEALTPSLDAGGVLFDHRMLDPASISNNDAIVGVIPGLGLAPIPSSLDLGTLRFGGLGSAALLSQYASSGLFSSLLNVENGGPQVYHNGSALRGRDLAFFPASAAGVRANRPYAIASNPNPDDVQGVVGPNTLSVASGPGQGLLLAGYFRYLFSGSVTPQVILDPTGTGGIGPFALQIDGILDDQGVSFPVVSLPVLPGFRDFEGLVLSVTGQLPAVTLPVSVDLQIVFADGGSFVLPGAVVVGP